MKPIAIGKPLQRWVLSILLPCFATTGVPLRANPQGGVVVHGAANIAQVAANQLRIHQQSRAVVINWQDFSINAGELTRFVQPANGTALNRVVSGNISQIYGQLKANANVYVVNPNGIVVGPGGVVDVGGRAVLSTLDIDDDDFLRGGPDRFYGNTNTGVTNFGTISSADGDVVLMGGFVENHGQIGAMNGTVAIGSGGDILLQEGAGAKISVRGSSDYEGTGITNTGTIRGAAAELKAHGNVYALAINNGGAIRATGADRSSGRVLLRASGGSSNINLGRQSTIQATAGADGGTVAVESVGGTVDLDGRVEAVGSRAGGTVSVTASQVRQSATSAINASGGQSGGTIAIDGANAVSLSGTTKSESGAGKGGEIAVTGQTVLINDGATISADGHSAGGRLRIGGDFQGQNTGLREAESTRVEAGALLTADSLVRGNGGKVIVWANGDTIFQGEVSASAKGSLGNGGLVEISGLEYLHFDGTARVGTVGGKAGTVLFDPGDVSIGATGTSPIGNPTVGTTPPTSTISIASVNDTLQNGAHVLVVTNSGNIVIENLGGGGDTLGGTEANNRHSAIQWTNSLSSFGAFASGSILVNNHIRTSGGGSINLLAGWVGAENDPTLLLDPQSAWDFYVSQGKFGNGGGSVLVGSSSMARHVEVGSRFGDTNVAGFDVRVIGSDSAANNRFAMIGFRDGGQVFAPRLDRGLDGGTTQIRLDMRVGAPEGAGAWLLSDGKNTLNQAAAGVGDPIVAIAGNDFGQEVDLNGDGIVDGVRGINSTGVVTDSFIPYANHFNSVAAGNWWWQQIEAAGTLSTLDPNYIKPDPLGLGALRPEHGAGVGSLSTAALALGAAQRGANINVLARGNVIVQAGSGNEAVGAMIGHGGPNRVIGGGAGHTTREIGNEAVNNAAFSNAGVEGNQIERRWAFNGGDNDRTTISIARLAPVYGNINVFAGVNTALGVQVNRTAGKVTARVTNGGTVSVRAAQVFDTGAPASNSSALIGHGGIGQFGEFYGDIHVEAGGSVEVVSGEATRAAASIGHTYTGHAYWNPTNVADQQLRFFATTSDFDNPNLFRGELFSGLATTGFDPARDPANSAPLRFTLGDGFADFVPNADPLILPTSWTFVVNTPGAGNFYPERNSVDGTLTGRFVNINGDGGNYANRTDPVTGDPISLRVIHMNPLLYTQGRAGAGVHSSGNTASQGRAALSSLQLAPTGPITVAALDGSVVNGLHGDVTVIARNGNLTVKAYSTEGITGSAARDRRFAKIGHGGSNFGFSTLGAGFQNILTTTTAPGNDAREIVNFHYNNGTGLETGSRSEYGTAGGDQSRILGFMSITGDIDVQAGGFVSVTAGNDVYDFAQIGHGGAELTDYETSSFILGDIRVRAGGDLTVTGGGGVQPINRGNAGDPNQGNYDLRAWGQIGHGGYRSGFMAFLGDIQVEAGGNIVVRNGAHSYSHGKIGHQGVDDFGQSGGDIVRSEHFRADGVQTNIATSLLAGSATITYSSANAHPSSVVGVRDFTASGAGTLVGGNRNTANISVRAGGTVRVDHLQMGRRQPAERLAWLGVTLPNPSYDADNQGQGIRTRNSYAQIGHGGHNTHVLNANNSATNFSAKLGDVSVRANGGDVIVQNGEGEQRWSRIGHGIGRSNRVDDGTNTGVVRSIDMAGNISVTASRTIRIDAKFADENERAENFNSDFGAPTPSRYNPAVIGHGGIDDNLDLVVLGRGESVKGLIARSDITATAGRNLSILGGKGTETSFAQLGHGFSSDLGNDAARRLGVPTGFAGDIDVVVGGNLYIEAGANAWSEQPDGLTDGTGRSVHGAFAAIGHGGYQLDAPSFGEITVFVGNDLDLIAQRRTDPRTSTAGNSPYNVTNPTPGNPAIGSAFNFAKIGHFAVENGNRTADGGDIVANATNTGDITVVVGRDLRLRGGTTPDIDDQPIFGAFAQIGHGGPAASGDKTGDITVLVKRDLSVTQGTDRTGAAISVEVNNYAMIGNGDYLKGTNASPSSIFRRESDGFRIGDLVIATGRHATFNGALVGHADPQISNIDTFGKVQIAASRLDPLFGGAGRLTATNGTVFSSGGFGRDRMEFYVPARSNNLMDGSTRINEETETFVTAPADFAAPFNQANGNLAGRADEVYLTPDLWWDQSGRAAEGGVTGGRVFPTDAVSGQGGALALVDDPGGLPNLREMVDGALGDSATVYRDANGVSGAGLYTIYYDAIEFVSTVYPEQPTAPGIPIPDHVFDFRGLFFADTYDAYYRDRELLDDELAGEEDFLYALLGIFERDEETVEESGSSRLENALDNAFGPRRYSYSEEEEDEERRRRRARGAGNGGPVGVTYYVVIPGTNEYSSFHVFGNRIGSFYPLR